MEESAGDVLRVLVIEDHELIRDGIALALQPLRACVACTLAGTGDEVAALQCPADGFDLIILDLGLPDANGLSLLPSLRTRFSLCPILVVSGQEHASIAHDAVAAGARGFVSKSARTEVLREAVKKVLGGEIYLDGLAADFLPWGESGAYPWQGLTPRQNQVLELMAQGLTNKAIANKLGTTEATVRAHATAIFRALGVENRTQAVLHAAQKSKTGFADYS